MRKSTRTNARKRTNHYMSPANKNTNNNNINLAVNSANSINNKVDNNNNNIDVNDEREFQVWLEEGYDVKSDPKWQKYEEWKSKKGPKTIMVKNPMNLLSNVPSINSSNTTLFESGIEYFKNNINNNNNDNINLITLNNDVTESSTKYLQFYIRETFKKSHTFISKEAAFEDCYKTVTINGKEKIDFALFDKNSYIISSVALKYCIQMKHVLRFRKQGENSLTILEQLFSYCRSPSFSSDPANIYAYFLNLIFCVCYNILVYLLNVLLH